MADPRVNAPVKKADQKIPAFGRLRVSNLNACASKHNMNYATDASSYFLGLVRQPEAVSLLSYYIRFSRQTAENSITG